MKKILITLAIIGMTSGSVLAYNNNIKMNTQQYISTLNTNIGEMNLDLGDKEDTGIFKVLTKGVDDGYIKPSINNDTKLKSKVEGFIISMKDTKIINNNLQIKHDELINNMNELVLLLNDTILFKNDLIKSDYKSLDKMQKLLAIDEKKIKLVNDKIDEINTVYQEINNFIK